MRARRCLSLLAVLLAAASSASPDVLFPRHPAPSPDGRELAFSWQGDIWVVPAPGGLARRLTAHPAYDAHPVWSPDGRSIAFTSDRRGNDDVFVMPTVGGPTRQLTFADASDRALDWSPDGTRVFISSYRHRRELWLPAIYSVPAEGGTPSAALPIQADALAILDDGTVVVSRGGGGAPWWRRGYRGPAVHELWGYDPTTEAVAPLLRTESQSFLPSWSSFLDGIVFLSEADSTYNVWMVTASGQSAPITIFRAPGVRHPRVSRHSDLVAFEYGDQIWTVRPGAAPAPLAIEAPLDSPLDGVARLEVTRADEYAVSPDGSQIALVFRGDIFVRRADEDASALVSLTRTFARERDLVWSPDSHSLLYASDGEGQYEIYRMSSADEDQPQLVHARHHEVERLTDTPEDEFRPSPSPDGERLAFARGLGTVVVAGADGGDPRVLVTGHDTPDIAWSPDGRFIAYTGWDDDFNPDIYVVPSEGGDPVNITRHPDIEGKPVWSADGRKLAFSGQRTYAGLSDIWYVWLRQVDDEKTVQEILDEAEFQSDDDDEDDDSEEEGVRVEIDFDDIHRRIHRVTRLPGDEPEAIITSDGQFFVFVSRGDEGRDLWKVRWDGEKQERLTEGGVNPANLSWHEESKRVFYLAGGKIASTNHSRPAKKRSYPLEGRVAIDLAAERRQMFEESWRILNANFYDPDFHGADWPAARERYRTLAESAAHPADFRDAMRLMLGELNSSHQQFYAPRRPESAVATGWLGIVPGPTEEGAIRVIEVLPETPAARASSRLEVGDVIEAVDGHTLGPQDNLYALLQDTVDQTVLLRVRDDDGKLRELAIRPTSRSRYRSAVWERDTRWRRSRVAALSDDRFGYINLQHMGAANVDRFERELYAEAAGKDGLVIDVRDNTGGWITDILLTSILAGDHAVTVPRGGGPGYPAPRRLIFAWTRPIVVICNEQTFSNGEIFTWAVQTLGRGKVVGQPTFGGVISTSNITLIDGSRVRMPFRGWYVKRGDAFDAYVGMEGQGCVPDVPVENLPDDYARGRDPQLTRAVAVLSAEVEP